MTLTALLSTVRLSAVARRPVRLGAIRLCASSSGALEPSSVVADTVFALSSGAGRAGVSVVRVSGPGARQVLLRMAPGRDGALPEARRAVLRSLRWPSAEEGGAPGEVIDQALALWFPAPRSFTGEDTVELHTHGSRAVVAAALDALGRLPGLRLAEPGEFTRQAFRNGRMDMTEVEGLGDLINADTEEQRKQALRQMGGAQRRQYDEWRAALLKSLAYTEALIDFGEDADDITTDALAQAVTSTQALRAEMGRLLQDGARGEVVRDGVRVAILGPPNAGKSTLLNTLAQRPAAIVSPIAGTTRDVVSVTLQLGGLPVLLADTAGLRAGSSDPIEALGMRRSADEARRAQLQLWVFDAAAPPTQRDDLDADAALEAFEEEAAAISAAAGEAGAAAARAAAEEAAAEREAAAEQLLVLNKIDLEPDAPPCALVPPERQWRLSCETQEGVGPFLDALADLVKERYASADREPVLITRARHREHLQNCVAALDAFAELAGLGEAAPLDLAAEELRVAAAELGRITGRIDVEELLDVIFRDFCIGK